MINNTELGRQVTTDELIDGGPRGPEIVVIRGLAEATHYDRYGALLIRGGEERRLTLRAANRAQQIKANLAKTSRQFDEIISYNGL
jgi:hypothetical protein